ncbi:MAG TPA: translation elongation factor Ts [Thermoanaerobaculia bacterium]|jgi:elongation factor Ts|nr:translation elongation factor Ts [Thermoanaerobaculia bacterium]
MTINPSLIKALREQTGAGFADVKSALTEANGDMEQATVILRKKGLAAAGKKAGRVTAEGTIAAHVADHVGVLVEVNCETDFVGRNENFRNFAQQVADVIAQSKANTVEELLAENWPGTSEPVSQKVAEQIAAIKENISIRRFARYEAPENAVIGTYIHGGGKIGVMVEIVSNNSKNSAQDEVAKDVAMHVAAAEPRFLNREDVTEKDLETEREIARDAAAKSGKPENIIEKMVTGKMEKFYSEFCLVEQPYIKDDKLTVTNYLKSRGKESGCDFTITRYTRYKLGEGIEKRSEDFAAEVASYINQ